jgi:hypothetical protein
LQINSNEIEKPVEGKKSSLYVRSMVIKRQNKSKESLILDLEIKPSARAEK